MTISPIDRLALTLEKALEAGTAPALALWTGADVRGFRDDMELSQQALARLCGVTRQTVALWESEPGKQLPAAQSWWLTVIDAALE